MKNEMCINCDVNLGEDIFDALECIKNVGFDGVFFDYREDVDLDLILRCTASHGLFTQSLHAPFGDMNALYKEDDSSECVKNMMRQLYGTVDMCEEYGIELMICHCIIGMNEHDVTERGLERIGRVIDYAAERYVNIAFENTEGIEYLSAVLERYGDRENVGFCIDTGHQLCYDHGVDLFEMFGDKLIATHLNDNFGQTGDEITFYDDCHLLPFDGVVDWNYVYNNLVKLDFREPLTFELNKKSRPTRHANDRYDAMSLHDYYAECYKRAVRFRDRKF